MARDALLDMYLKDVSVFPVLTRESEQVVSRRLRAGDVARVVDAARKEACEREYQPEPGALDQG